MPSLSFSFVIWLLRKIQDNNKIHAKFLATSITRYLLYIGTLMHANKIVIMDIMAEDGKHLKRPCIERNRAVNNSSCVAYCQRFSVYIYSILLNASTIYAIETFTVTLQFNIGGEASHNTSMAHNAREICNYFAHLYLHNG